MWGWTQIINKQRCYLQRHLSPMIVTVLVLYFLCNDFNFLIKLLDEKVIMLTLFKIQKSVYDKTAEYITVEGNALSPIQKAKPSTFF